MSAAEADRPLAFWKTEDPLKSADELFEQWWKLVEEDKGSASVSFEALNTIPYVHGGYMGAAPLLLLDREWVQKVLRILMPETYVEVAKKYLFEWGKPRPWHKLMKWAENNPVVAAYGTLASRPSSSSSSSWWTPTPLEWDIFLDPAFVREVEKELTGSASDSSSAVVDWVQDRLNKTDDVFWVAHGSVLQLAIESIGLTPQLNYNSVRRSSPTEGGGVSARRWVATFAAACELGIGMTESHSANTSETELQTFLDTATLEESVIRLEAVMADMQKIKREAETKPRTLFIFLDIKARRIPTRVWYPILKALHQSGLQIIGCGSFFEEDVRGIGKEFGTADFQEFLFFHSAGHVQQACLAGTLQPGEVALFSAGSLLWQPPSFFGLVAAALGWGGGRRRNENDDDNDNPYQLLPFCQVDDKQDGKKKGSTLQDFKEHYQVSLGLYCQEYDMDDAAIQLVAKYVNANSQVYDMGLCWGGRNGTTVDGVREVDGLTDGFGAQRFLAQTWNASRYPPSFQNETRPMQEP